MCGIIMGISETKNVNQQVIDQLENQITRGQKGFGIIYIDKENKVEIRRATELTKVLVDLYMKESKKIILHHRFPTSSDNQLDQTHPIEINNGSLKYKYLVIHNGVVTNNMRLKREHEELGFVYTTEYTEKIGITDYVRFNDSESVGIEVARLIEKQTNQLDLRGSVAFIAIKINKKTNKAINIYYGRNEGSPLKLAKSRGNIFMSSEGMGSDVKPFMLYEFNLKDLKLKKTKLIIEEIKEEIEITQQELKPIQNNEVVEVKKLNLLKTIKPETKKSKEEEMLEEEYLEVIKESRQLLDARIDEYMESFEKQENLFADIMPDVTVMARNIVESILETQATCKQLWLEREIPDDTNYNSFDNEYDSKYDAPNRQVI